MDERRVRVCLPTISRKKLVPTKYYPNTFRTVCYDEDCNKRKYLDTPNDIRAEDPLGVRRNKRPNSLLYKTQVLPQQFWDYRSNRPHVSQGVLLQNYHTYCEPVFYINTDDQSQGHWLAPIVTQEEIPRPPYSLETTSRTSFPMIYDTQMVDRRQDREKFKPKKLRAPWEQSMENTTEKISFNHIMDCRSERIYPVRGKRHGTFYLKNKRTENPEKNLVSESIYRI